MLSINMKSDSFNTGPKILASNFVFVLLFDHSLLFQRQIIFAFFGMISQISVRVTLKIAISAFEGWDKCLGIPILYDLEVDHE